MNTESGELLGIDPIELRFPFELNKQISCTLQLTNKTDKQVAFKVKTTSPKKYCVRPNNGMVAARSKADVVVTMQAQRDVPPDMQCKDKFLVQSAIVAKEIMPKEVTGDMFTKDSGNIVDEVKLKAVYVAPSSSQSEGYEDGNLGSLSYQEETKEPKESEKIISEPFALISKLMEEKNSAVELNNKLRQELDLLRRDISRQHGGFSLVLVLVVAILGILLGFLMKR
ncbi:vesicle-associated protein 1-2-like isoform X3 [Miscanthus floridulus]|uniref:vesicle-associated protein 1-2-like isoform X3 n=1 Tax=Miscanthus floridulus TaxID=154761 RepID=UPI00345A08F3